MIDMQGRTVVCIASGPSLTAADCQLVEASGHPAIVVNTSWRLAPFASVLLAGDAAWWDANPTEAGMPARRVCCLLSGARKHEIEFFKPRAANWNSGMAAIWYAEQQGASKVVLLGYDCKAPDGRRHWHQDHEKTKNPPLSLIEGWTRRFAQMQVSVQVVNASRDTAITRWPRIALEDAL